MKKFLKKMSLTTIVVFSTLVFSIPASAGKYIFVKGETLQHNLMDSLIALPDGNPLFVSNLITGFWGVNYNSDDILIYDLTLEKYFILNQGSSTLPSLFNTFAGHEKHIYDPVIQGFMRADTLSSTTINDSSDLLEVLSVKGRLVFAGSQFPSTLDMTPASFTSEIDSTDTEGESSITNLVENQTSTPDVESNEMTMASIVPIANYQYITTDEDNRKNVLLAASNDTNESLIYHISSKPINGTLTGIAPNLNYKPNANYFGSDYFTFTAENSAGKSKPAIVWISVNSVNDAPTVKNQTYATNVNTSIKITLNGNDKDKDALKFKVLKLPKFGVISGKAPYFTYTPKSTFFGTDSITFKANDSTTDSNIGILSITVKREKNSIISYSTKNFKLLR